MTTTADRTIAALRSGHDALAGALDELTPTQLAGPSGASEWSIAQVLSHLGSGAEIGLAALEAALNGEPRPGGEFNQSVWDRWNAMDAVEQAESFVKADEALVTRYEGLDEGQRTDLRVDLGYLPAPVDVATVAGFRLNEFTLHTWDVAVAFDPTAVLAPDAVELLLDIAPKMFGWLGRPGEILDGRTVKVAVEITDPTRAFGLVIADGATLSETPDNADGTLNLPAESWLRLVSGRLAEPNTPSGVVATGAVSLPQLRQIFPGY